MSATDKPTAKSQQPSSRPGDAGETLKESPAIPPRPGEDGKPATGKDLLAALVQTGFIGAWKHRTDIGDSVEFARRLRGESEVRGGE